ncbi:3-hydroxyisobutyryl-CoA hydrolase, mitochondrial [Parasteatoda tepidariorum]|uniref:3-hydroxyisobutyryl-CoA hydrolase, mitochondrial n=1 Tax=Parasteatoda tepidariorum TaxID=114398 RepID=UPI001C72784C|nr:3-hydroxyisobutyryl-CoA hydrolase, mitochondrial [Parasteatoda tepidariorum]
MTILSLYCRNLRKLPISLVRTTWAAMSMNNEVILETAGNKGVITLNRPKALNSLNLNMIRKIYPQLKAWDTNPDIKLVIVKSSSERAFCAGGDVRALAEAHKAGNPTMAEEFFREEYQLNNLIGTLQIPYVALIDGITMGGGIGISVHGAFRVCTERTVCAMPEAAIGFFPDVGGSYFLPRLPGKIGLFLALTGYRLQGRDVFKAGIATHFVDTGGLKHLETELMRLENPTLSDVDRILLKFHQQCEADYKKEFALKPVMGKMNTVFEADSVETIMENLKKEGSEWSRKNYEAVKKLSPTSLKVSFEQLKRGADMTLQNGLVMEYRLCQRFMADHDFHDGVRAVLIDRDNKPTWKPATLEEVSAEKVNSYFEPLPTDKALKL